MGRRKFYEENYQWKMNRRKTTLPEMVRHGEERSKRAVTSNENNGDNRNNIW
jgi:hypothetical protein